jgi:hypothetical protein
MEFSVAESRVNVSKGTQDMALWAFNLLVEQLRDVGILLQHYFVSLHSRWEMREHLCENVVSNGSSARCVMNKCGTFVDKKVEGRTTIKIIKGI